MGNSQKENRKFAQLKVEHIPLSEEKENTSMLFKGWFLNALKDQEVREVIKQITADAIVNIKLQVPESTKVVELERQLESTQKQLDMSNKRLDGARHDRDVSQKQAETANEELREAKSALKRLQGLAAMDAAYDRYKKLPPALRERLEDVLNGRDLLSFVCSGVQESSMERFWSVCNEAFLDDEKGARELTALFDEFFDLAQSLGTLVSQERLDVKPGSRFDNDLCTRIARSAPTGNVKEVLLQGYRYKVSRKVVKKSLVLV